MRPDSIEPIDLVAARIDIDLDAELGDRLELLSRRHGATLYATLVAGWAVLLGRLSTREVVVIGGAGMQLRFDLQSDLTVASLLQQCEAWACTAFSPVSYAWNGDSDEATAPCDLTLTLQERAGRITGELEYATALFDAATIGRYLEHWWVLLEGMVADENCPVYELPLLTSAQRHQIVVQWNETERPYPAERGVHAVFEEQAARTPQATAVQVGTHEVSYAELNARANRLARRLVSRGVRPRSAVGIALERSVELLVAQLAVLKAGCAYVPLDAVLPRRRQEVMLADCAASHVIGGAGQADFGGVDWVVVEEPGNEPGEEPGSAENLDGTDSGAALAYIMYTSGSTGVAKGVRILHRSINRLAIDNGYLDFQPGDRVALAANPAFDASSFEIWGALLNGARVVVIDQETLLDPPRFVEALQRGAVTVLWLTVGLFNQYAQALSGLLPGLRYLMVGGDVLDPRVMARVLREGPPQHLLNGYGPTETTTFASTYRIESVSGQRSIPIGRPISNTQIYILDRLLQPVPIGVVGEIYIGGAGVADGYLNQPELTAQRFLHDPFGTEPGARMYRSGDLGRWRADGNIEYLGRNDTQVKIRGFRIELGEIESKLTAIPGVREAVVLAREEERGEKRLVAYVVAQPDCTVDPEGLRQGLASDLAQYMVPSAYVILSALPLTANGKVDRNALPAPTADAFISRGYAAPEGPIESALADLWSDLLGVTYVGRHDDFFELGGHSLLAVRLSSRLQSVFGASVTLSSLFAHPTIAAFAAKFAVELSLSAETPLPVMASSSHEISQIPSFAQKRLWFLARMEGASATYNLPFRMQLSGPLDKVALRRSLDRLLHRHDALRATFAMRDGRPLVTSLPRDSRFALVEHDLTQAPDVQRQLERWCSAEIEDSFDLSRGPLIRGRLIGLMPDVHVLLLTLHHIVADGWSIGVLCNELNALYDAFISDADDPLPPLAIQYADYAAWQRQQLSGEASRHQAAYWQKTLAQIPALLDLPTDRPRPKQQSFEGATLDVGFDAKLTGALKSLSRRHGTTLFMTLLTAWAALLSRLSGQHDLVIGTPFANRTRRELESLIGFFVNTVALRVDVSDDPTVSVLLARVRETALAAQDHQDLPFEQVVDLVRPARSLAHSPVFQVMLAWQNTPQGNLHLRGISASPLEAQPVGTAKFDLTFGLQEQGGEIVGTMEYATALFDAPTIARHVEHWRILLEAMVADDTQTVSSLPLLSAAQRHQVLVGWNATTVQRTERCIHQLFEDQVTRTPEGVAVIFEGGEVSYRELNSRANRLAHHLQGLGVGPEARVGICAQRSVEMVVGLLGILKAGGAYVPLDPTYPKERLSYLLQDSEPTVVLTQLPSSLRSELSEVLQGRASPVLDLSADAALWAQASDENPAFEGTGLSSRSLAYVIYTSGSTGQPKGVMVEHASVVNLIHGHIEQCELTAADRVLQFASFAFDASVEEIYPALSVGAAIVLRPPRVMAPDAEFLRLLREARVTVAELPTAFWQHWAQSEADCGECLRLVVVGGEKTERRHLDQWRLSACGRRSVWLNTYGPTEATVYAIALQVAPGQELPPGEVPIGHPTANTQIYILDGRRQPVPIGVAGEIYIGGAGVARGYWRRPELTSQRFTQDPFAAQPGARLYQSGDLGRWLADGTLEYLGRNDSQVKIRGFRIELGEIEAKLAALPGVREALVLAREDVPGEKRLVAYLTTDTGIDLDIGDLRSRLSTELPEHMVPSAFVALDALPLTPNGKLDRSALPAPADDAFVSREYVPPDGAIEETLAAIWSSLLRRENVGRHDNFFELGGHSLLAVQLVWRTQQRLHVELPLSAVFSHPVLTDFASLVDSAACSAAPTAAIEPADRTAPLPLSFAQQRLWFVSQMDEVSRAYHIPLMIELRGDLDREALAAALNRIVARHETLRTTFEQHEGGVLQVIGPVDAGMTLQFQDLSSECTPSGGQDGERLCRMQRHLTSEAATSFDLHQGPLIRARLLRSGARSHVLCITMHHIVSDGWSVGVLLNELGALYNAYSAAGADLRRDPLPALPVQYADYAVWQRQWLSGDREQRQARYWQQQLKDAPALLELPADRPRPLRQSHRGARLDFKFEPVLTQHLKRLSQACGGTLFVTLLSGWAILLARLSGQDEVVIGSPSANRSRQDVEPLIGFFVNTLALRIDLSGAPTCAELLARVRRTALDAQDHQDLPFEQIVDLIQPVRSSSHTPVFQVMFAWQNTPVESLKLDGLSVSEIDGIDGDTAKCDLTVSLQEREGCIVGELEYATALFDATTVERYLEHWRVLLEGMVADENRPVYELPLLTAAQRHQIVVDWNDTQRAYPSHRGVHGLFEDQVERTPQATAVQFGRREVSYTELNEQANRLARRLASRGVVPGAIVAVALQRSIELIVAQLAVLKASAAYVPLDAVLPPRRQAMMLEDCAARHVIGGVEHASFEGCERIDVDDPSDEHWSAENLDGVDSGAALAYIMYTSGSTGVAKGVRVLHRSISRLVIDNGYLEFEAGDRVAFTANPAFDASTFEIWGPLLNGARVVAIDQETLLDPQRFVETLQSSAVNVQFMTIGLFNQYAHALLPVLPAFRYLMTGGDVLDPRVIARVLREGAPQHLMNVYGPTETTTFATFHRIESVSEHRSIPIGRPISNTQIYILDRLLQPVPIGVAGEIYIGGPGVADGYLNRPDLTAQRFLHDPFGTEPGARMYRSGDLGRWRVDGNIEYLGRNDTQVKIRGFRIELGEIESKLTAIPGVREAVVLARVEENEAPAPGAAEPGEKRLMAYLTLDADATVSAGDCRRQLLTLLPEYMVPSAYVILAALPLTVNGKVDRGALPAPTAEAYVSRGYAAPQGANEEALADIWSKLLRHDQIGRFDNFFELGGHSLLAVQLSWHIRERFAVEVPLRTIFSHPVLADFAATLAPASSAPLPTITLVDRDEPLALSFAQQRLWFLAQMEGGSRAYHVPLNIRFRGELNREALTAALNRIVARHEVLRSTFQHHEGAAVQLIAPRNTDMALRLENWNGKPDDNQQRLHRMLLEEANVPFDLRHGPLIRARMIRTGPLEHALCITMHHIVSDGWSLGVLLNELSALYDSYRRPGADVAGDPLPALPIQYADYAAWQRQWLTGERQEQQAAYWKQQLAGASALLELPTDRPRPAKQSYAGACVAVSLDTELSRRLKAFSQRQGVTLYMTLIASWGALLARLSGQEDIVIGTPTANRGRREFESLIGFFVNTLALRIQLSTDITSLDLLKQVRQTSLAAQDHQDLPFEQVVDIVQPSRSLAYTPIFQAMFAWQNAPAGASEFPGLSWETLATQSDGTSKFDLTLSLEDRAGRITGELEYATALFDATTVERYLEHWRVLLEGMVADENRPVYELPLLTAAQRHQIVVDWNDTQRAYPSHRGVHGLFEDQVERTPQATAVQFGRREVSYTELNEQANRLARRLASRGVVPGAIVAVALQRSIELIVAQLAVLKASAAYVPLDAVLPPRRQAMMLEDCAARHVIGGVEHASFEGCERIDVDDPSDEHWSAENLDGVDSGAALAYIMYTSGSTGVAKGVRVLHRSISRLVIDNGYLEFEAGDRVAFTANPAFDASTFEIWGPLLNGARVVAIDQETLLDPQRFVETLQSSAVNVQFMTIGLFNQYAHALLPVLPAFRYLMTGGDVLDPRVIARVLREGAPQHLMNVYGPTETTTFATFHRIESVSEHRSIPIGRPISNTQIYILDRLLQPVPIGVAGEIYIGGPGVADGYLNRPDLTAQRFLHDPFGTEPGARMYRSGDLGRWRVDGNIEYLGRNDTQVKIRGFRIELGEIESKLTAIPGVREAVVLARVEERGEKRLVAYVVAQPDCTVDPEGLREGLASDLAHYMVPSAYVILSALPLTANGKVDRNALPAPTADAFISRGYAAAQGETEEALAHIWSVLLNHDAVGRFDNFFELGGHSLLAVKLLWRIRERFDVEAPLSAVFSHPVLADLAVVLEQTAGIVMPPMVPADRSVPVPLSFAQQRLWFLAQMDGVSRAYHMPWSISLEGELNRDALAATLNRLVARHESLRTTFEQHEDGAVQVIGSADAGMNLCFQDLSEEPDGDRPGRLLRELADEAESPFDLQRGPLIRARVLSTSARAHVLCITMHHIVSDGWSLGVMMNELSALYAAYRQPGSTMRGDPLPALPIQYADYAIWQRQMLSSESQQRQARYWQQTLAGSPALLELPTDRPRPARQSHAGAYHDVRFDAEFSRRLKAFSQRHGVTLYMTLITSWAALLARLSGQEDIVIGSPIAGRSRSETELLIGFFVNALVLRFQPLPDQTVAELIANGKQRIMAAQQHQDLPFEQIVDIVQPPRSLAHAPIFQVMFAWQNTPAGKLELPGLIATPLDVYEGGTAKFDLSLSMEEADGQILGSMEYATALFDRATIERHFEHWRTLLDGMMGDDHHALCRLPLLSARQRHELLVEWNATAAAYPADRCLHEAFEEWAERTPEAIALVFDEEQLSYGELNTRANRVAQHLRGLGVGPDDRVAIRLERGIEMVIAVLGTLKAGGAYVPLDPDYPEERLAYMLTDCGPAAVLTKDALRDIFAQGEVSVACNLDRSAMGLRSTHLAYVIYTSGSTGQPKGVAVEHGNVVNLLTDWCGRFSERERTTQLVASFWTSIGFDVSVFELFAPLSLGGMIHIVPRTVRGDPRALLQWLSSRSITFAYLPPFFVRSMRNEPAEAIAALRLKRVLVGVEPLLENDLSRLQELIPGLRIINGYGPTEAAVFCTTYADIKRADRLVPIGRPITNAQVYILDALGQPAPIGVVGEIYIGGAGIARGYLHRPALTAERFLNDRFRAGAPGRVYKTGDLGRWLSDGNIEYVGRNDFQVKIRGFRVELGEIESKLTAIDGIRDAVVVAREEQEGDKRLVAYLVCDEGSTVDAATLRDSLSRGLAEHMLPSAYVMLAALPLTVHGKMDRKALPAPDAHAFIVRDYEAPEGEMEETLAGIWSVLLKHDAVGRPAIGRHDNFFELGGHSLLAVQLVTKIRDAFKVEISLEQLFANATVSKLNECIIDARLEHLEAFDDEELEELLARMTDASDTQH